MRHSRFIADACNQVAAVFEADKENAVRGATIALYWRSRQDVTLAWGRGALYMASAVLVILLIAAVIR